MGRPGGWQATSFSTKDFCPPSISSCTTPSTLTSITPVDIPDSLKQGSGTVGGALVKDKTFFFASVDFTNQNRTTQLSSTLPSFVLDANGDLTYVGQYRQELLDARIDQKLSQGQTLMVRANYDNMFDTNPQRRRHRDHRAHGRAQVLPPGLVGAGHAHGGHRQQPPQ